MSEPRSRVYFIKPVGMDGPIKIGCSGKPLKRLQTLSAWSPFVLELIGSVKGCGKDETLLHQRFANFHTHREWFMSSPQLRQTIERILGGMSVKEACAALEPQGSIRNQKRPARTPDRELFLKYGHAVRKARDILWLKEKRRGRWKCIAVEEIMHNWRCDRNHGHEPITPTPEQFAILDAYIADPKPLCVFEPWPDFSPKETSAEAVAA